MMKLDYKMEQEPEYNGFTVKGFLDHVLGLEESPVEQVVKIETFRKIILSDLMSAAEELDTLVKTVAERAGQNVEAFFDSLAVEAASFELTLDFYEIESWLKDKVTKGLLPSKTFSEVAFDLQGHTIVTLKEMVKNLVEDVCQASEGKITKKDIKASSEWRLLGRDLSVYSDKHQVLARSDGRYQGIDFTKEVGKARILGKKVNEMESFLRSLDAEYKPVKARAELLGRLEAESSNDNKLNWLGNQADCKVLITYLKNNGYIEAGHLNQFLSRHFCVKGKSLSSESWGKVQTNRDASFNEFSNRLEIPRKIK